MNLSSIKPNFSTANTANTLVQRDASGKVAVSLANSAITGEAALTAVAGDDAILVSDTSEAAIRKVAINDLLTFMKTNTTSQLAIFTFTCGVGTGKNLPTGMAIQYNPFGLAVGVNSNRIQLGAGNWQIEVKFSGYANSWNGWGGSNTSEQYPVIRMQIDSAASADIAAGPNYTFSMGGLNAAPASWHQPGSDNLIIQAKVASVGYVTPIREMYSINGGVGVYGGRCVAYVYKI